MWSHIVLISQPPLVLSEYQQQNVIFLQLPRQEILYHPITKSCVNHVLDIDLAGFTHDLHRIGRSQAPSFSLSLNNQNNNRKLMLSMTMEPFLCELFIEHYDNDLLVSMHRYADKRFFVCICSQIKHGCCR